MEVRWELDCSKVAPDVRKDGDGGEKNPPSSSVQELTLRGTVIAQGYYGRPHELEDSASEFLCVKAGVMGVNGAVIEPIEFVIDTLSESVTLTQDHFNECKKKFLTRKTIHGPNSISYKEDIYIGSVLIGQHLFEIEVSVYVSCVSCDSPV